MKPISALALVLVAVAALVFALTRLDSGGSTGTIEPGPPKGSQELRPSTPGPITPTGPEREVAKPAEPQGQGERTGIASEGFENRLSSRVQNQSGQPVADAEVTLTRAGGMAALFGNTEQDRTADRKTTTRKDGTFSFDNVVPYAHYAIEVDHPDYSRVQVDEVNVGVKGTFEEPTIVLGSGATLAGNVRDKNGVGIAGATLVLGPMFLPTQAAPPPGSRVAESDEFGAYRIGNVAPGHMSMRVSADGFANALVTGLTFQAVEEIERDIVLEVAERICGRVVGPNNAPIPGAEILALSISNRNQQCQDITFSDQDGRFCLERLAPGRYTIGAKAPGYKAGRGDRADTGEANLVIEMEPQALVRGKVIDAATSQPLTSFRVLLRTTYEGQDQTSATEIKAEVQHPAGEFELGSVPPSPTAYVIEASAPGYAPSFSEPFRVSQGQLVAGVVVRATKGGAIVGVVQDSSGKAVGGAVIETFADDWVGNEFDLALGDILPSNVTRKQVRSGGDGSFRLDLLKPDVYQVRVKAANHCEHIQTGLMVVEGRDASLGTVRLIQGGRITGLVVDQAGRPVEGVSVRMNVAGMTEEQPRFYQTKTNAEGRYNFTNVFPGNYRLFATPRQPNFSGADFFSEVSNARASEQNVKVSDGQTYTIELRLSS